MGRVPTDSPGSRTIDIDILFASDEIINTESLVIPHPRIADRNFVLVPLTEIAPEMIHPVLHEKVKVVLQRSTDQAIVRKV